MTGKNSFVDLRKLGVGVCVGARDKERREGPLSDSETSGGSSWLLSGLWQYLDDCGRDSLQSNGYLCLENPTHWAFFSRRIVSHPASSKEFSVSAREKDPVEKLKWSKKIDFQQLNTEHNKNDPSQTFQIHREYYRKWKHMALNSFNLIILYLKMNLENSRNIESL